MSDILPQPKILFSDFFQVDKQTLDEYGAFNISLLSDLPLFIDPFLLFNSEKEQYQKLHEQIIQYLKFLRDKSTTRKIDDGMLSAWYEFKEVKQNWFGFSAQGNRGSALGRTFATALNENFNKILNNYGEEGVTKGVHLEKLCLIKDRVGRDNISDFTTNLIKHFLLEYTERFTKAHLNPECCQHFRVSRARFHYQTETWKEESYYLPKLTNDQDGFVILTPKDLLTKGDTWINRTDMIEEFANIPWSVSDYQLRSQINNYFQMLLPHHPKKKDRQDAARHTIAAFPQLIDYYIKYKEENGDLAADISLQNVDYSKNLYLEHFTALAWLLYVESPFYETKGADYHEGLERIHHLKEVVERGGGYQYLYDKNGEQIKTEDDLKILYRIIWNGLGSNNGNRDALTPSRIRGGKTPLLVEFKLATNNHLLNNLEKYREAKESGEGDREVLKVVFCFTDAELRRVRALVEQAGLQNEKNITLIDVRKNKAMAVLDPVVNEPLFALEKDEMKQRSMDEKSIVLFIAANPLDTEPLKLDEEARAIDRALQQTQYRERFDIKQQWAARIADLQGMLLRYKPDIVHFSGHGSRASEIILQDELGNSHPVSVRALSTLFSVLKDNIRCVVLNACYSEQQAQEIAKHVDYVIGMSKAIGDEAAIGFARSFYQALGYNRDFETAFKLGCSQIDLENLNDQDVPQLMIKGVHVSNN